jgi:aminoglycoside phosphotransferase (APT) family kinase protein
MGAVTKIQTNTFSGFYNKNYKIYYKEKPYILRIPIQNADSMDLRLIAEDDALAFLSKHSELCVPKVEMKETYNGQNYFLHSFINGETLEDVYPESCAIPDWIVEEIAKAVISLHKIPVENLDCFAEKMPWKLETNDFYNYIYGYNRGLIEKYNKSYREIFNIFDMPEDLDSFIENKSHEVKGAAFIFAHSDIHRKNIIISEAQKKLTIIDWELTLIAADFYDISIHFHKMRYLQPQEKLFLSMYCRAFGIDNDFAEKQIKLYREIEEVKSVAIDTVRYLSIINDISDTQIISNAKRYYSKLCKAYICWKKDPGALNEDDICRFFMGRKGIK